MADPITLGVLGGLAVIQAGMQYSRSKKDAQAEINAQTEYNTAAQAELTREQNEELRIAEEQKSDRLLQAEKELALVRVANADRGAGIGMQGRYAAEIGGLAGTDVSRIENSRLSSAAAIQAQKIAVSRGARNASRAAQNSAETARTGLLFSVAASGAQIGSSYYTRTQRTAISKNQQAARNAGGV